jgi:hypothetical protein
MGALYAPNLIYEQQLLESGSGSPVGSFFPVTIILIFSSFSPGQLEQGQGDLQDDVSPERPGHNGDVGNIFRLTPLLDVNVVEPVNCRS